MKKRNLTVNYIFNTISQVITLLAPIIIIPHVSKSLGADSVGSYAFSNSIMLFFAFFSIYGLNFYGTKKIAAIRTDKNKFKTVFFEIMILKTFSFLLFEAIYIPMCFTIWKENQFLYLVQGIYLVSVLFDINWFFQAQEEFVTVSIRNITIRMISTVLIFIFINSSDDLLIYALILIGTELVVNIFTWIGLPKYKVFNDFKNNIKDINLKKCFIQSLVMFVPQIIIQLYTTMNTVMVGFLSSDAEVGYLDRGLKIVNMLLMLTVSLGQIMAPRISNLYQDGKQEDIKRLLDKSARFTLLLSLPIVIGLCLISNQFVPNFFGDEYLSLKIILPILSLKILFAGLSNVTGSQYMLPTNKNKQFLISVSIAAITNISLNFVLIPSMGALGAAISIAITEGGVLVAQLFFCNKEIDTLKNIMYMWKSLIAVLIMGIFVYLTSIVFINQIESFLIDFLNTRISSVATIGIIYSVFIVIIAVIIYFGILFMMKDAMLIMALNKVKSRFKKGDLNEEKSSLDI